VVVDLVGHQTQRTSPGCTNWASFSFSPPAGFTLVATIEGLQSQGVKVEIKYKIGLDFTHNVKAVQCHIPLHQVGILGRNLGGVVLSTLVVSFKIKSNR